MIFTAATLFVCLAGQPQTDENCGPIELDFYESYPGACATLAENHPQKLLAEMPDLFMIYDVKSAVCHVIGEET